MTPNEWGFALGLTAYVGITVTLPFWPSRPKGDLLAVGDVGLPVELDLDAERPIVVLLDRVRVSQRAAGYLSGRELGLLAQRGAAIRRHHKRGGLHFRRVWVSVLVETLYGIGLAAAVFQWSGGNGFGCVVAFLSLLSLLRLPYPVSEVILDAEQLRESRDFHGVANLILKLGSLNSTLDSDSAEGTSSRLRHLAREARELGLAYDENLLWTDHPEPNIQALRAKMGWTTL